jgi:hypothetical protein
VQTGAPDVQTIAAVAAHGFDEAHEALGVHALHKLSGGVPLTALHTPVVVPCVHAVPAARNV